MSTYNDLNLNSNSSTIFLFQLEYLSDLLLNLFTKVELSSHASRQNAAFDSVADVGLPLYGKSRPSFAEFIGKTFHFWARLRELWQSYPILNLECFWALSLINNGSSNKETFEFSSQLPEKKSKNILRGFDIDYEIK